MSAHDDNHGLTGGQVSPLDGTFLELEDADPAVHMHIGAVLLFDAFPDQDGAPALERVRSLLSRRLDQLPRLRQRLSSATVGPLRWPEWVDDDRFDLSRHLRRAALPNPAGAVELDEWSGEFFSRRLDRAHPLWEAVVIERVDGGRWTLAIKLHHCIADGMGALGLAYRLLCEESAAPPPKSPRPSGTTLAGLPLAALREGADLLVHPRRIEHAVRSAGAGAELLAREQLDPAPQTSVNQPIGSDRRYASVTVPLRQLTEIEHALGGTVTDALLTTVAGALGRLLAARDEGCPADGLRAMVPVDVRRPDDVAEGNRISSLFVRLPVDVEQPLARHAAVKRETARVKHDDQQGGSSALVAVSGLAPPLLHRTLARLFATPRLFNLTVTSMRGPEQPLLVDGARLRQIHALVPLAPAHTLGVAIVSHAGATTFGVIADRDAVPDLDVFTAGLRASHAQLRRAARRRAALGPGEAVQSALEGIPN